MGAGGFRHIDTQSPRIMVVDGSKLARKMIEQLLRAEVPEMEFIGCETGAQAKQALLSGQVNLITTALALPDMDGLELAKYIREYTPQAFIPIIVVSGNVQERLESRDLSSDVTDYFDKSLGFGALAAFIRGYVKPADEPGGEVLYIEDSRVVAVATKRMMEKHGLKITHMVTVEEALERLQVFHDDGTPPPDILLSDVYLKGDLTGSDLLERVRRGIGYSKMDLPIIMMTGDSDPANQSALLRAGANDLVEKPIEENLLIAKLLFQLRTGRVLRAKHEAMRR
ncbi:MAG: response regulator [Proteobacteria bacterium]|nr:response regulator [Pseudomonadota bacterium]